MERLEIVRAKKEGKEVINVTKFESEKIFGLVIDGNKRNAFNQQETMISRRYFAARIANRDTAQEREEIDQNKQQELSTNAKTYVNLSRLSKANPKAGRVEPITMQNAHQTQISDIISVPQENSITTFVSSFIQASCQISL